MNTLAGPPATPAQPAPAQALRYTHRRLTEDKHILSHEPALRAPYLALMGQVGSNDALKELISTYTPDANWVRSIPDAPEHPSEMILRAILDCAAARGVTLKDWTEARQFLFAEGFPEHERLAILRRVPPPEIHRMQRAEHWFGDVYSANMCVKAMAEAGLSLDPGMTVLDYGGSSGSLLRVLAYCYPQVNFLGCDPVDSSVDWAQANLTFDNLRFFHQQQEPPLELEDASVDVATAVSIFSHHGINATTDWLAELARVIRPGGHFVLTYNDIGALMRAAEDDVKFFKRVTYLYATVLSCDYAFEEVWIDEDDAGNAATIKEWGNSFYRFTLFCALAAEHFTPVFRARRMNQGRQDVLILRRR